MRYATLLIALACLALGACGGREVRVEVAAPSAVTASPTPAVVVESPTALGQPTTVAGDATCVTGEPPKDGLEVMPGGSGDDRCVWWLDSYSDEVGFRVMLFYPVERLLRVYDVPPDVTSFVYPPEDQPHAVPGRQACERASRMTVEVWVLRPEGIEARLGGYAAGGHCPAD